MIATRARAGISALVVLWLGSLAHAQGWEIPQAASTERSPLSPTPAVLKNGRGLYASYCAKCHGPEGKGDGPDATNDLAHRPPDLTRALRARFNPDPIYLAGVPIFLGIYLVYAADRRALDLLFPAVLGVTLHLVVVRLEEPALRRRLGREYEEYCRRVPRWIPRLPVVAGGKQLRAK